MAWNGTGTYIQVTPVASGSNAWADTKAAGDLNVTTTDHDYHDQDLANGITNCMAKDGQNAATANLNMGGYRLTNMANAVSTTDAVTLSQIQFTSALPGDMRGAKMNIPAASATATFTAKFLTVAGSGTGRSWKLVNYSQTIDVSTVGAGGMDTGAAPVSGWVALYAIYNVSTAATSILAVDTTSAVAPTIYAGSHMPAGYSASALISVWPTNSSSLLGMGFQVNRDVRSPNRNALTSSTQHALRTSLSLVGIVPQNANYIDMNVSISSTVSATLAAQIYSDTSTAGANSGGVGTSSISFLSRFALASVQTIYYIATVSSGTMALSLDVIGYEF